MAVGLASKEAIIRVPHQLLSAKLQGKIKKWVNTEQDIKSIGKLSKYCNFSGNTLLIFLFLSSPFPVYTYVTEMES